MSATPTPRLPPEQPLERQLTDAWQLHREQPEVVRRRAQRCAAQADSAGDPLLIARARALECAVAMHQGDMRQALELAVEADQLAASTNDLTTLAELAAVRATFRFFSGSYAEAIRQADLAVQYADECGELRLRIQARAVASMVFGTVGVRDRLERFTELLELSQLAEDGWQEALARNDIACHHQELGELEQAEHWIAQARATAEQLPGENRFTLAVINSSHADIHLAAGRPQQALRSARRSVLLLETQQRPNPYVFAASIRAELQAQIALGSYDEARITGEEALDWLGERLPRARAAVLSSYAQALREAGRHEHAYDALSRALELERDSFRELSELQLILERATFEARIARKEADRDWLTGLHNRRYLARELRRIDGERREGPISIAAIDLDHFKAINDRFGHTLGDRVLVHAANLVRRLTRDADITVRSGGEEFLVVMPQTESGAARFYAHRIHEAIRTEDWDALAPGLLVTASVGVASGQTPAQIQELMARADQHLYEAKRRGRDQVAGDE